MKQNSSMKFKTMTMQAMAVCASLLVAACGGGGSDSSGTVTTTPPAPAVKTYPIESAVTAFNTSSHTNTLTYTDSKGNVFTIEYSNAPGADASFNGQAAKTSVVTAVLKLNGALVETTSQTVYFQIAPFKVLGTLDSDGLYSIAANQGTLPASAKVGDTGSFFTSTEYASASSSTIVSHTVGTWTLEANTADTAYFCKNDSITDNTVNAQPVTSSECYRVNAAGTVLGMRVTVTMDGQTFVFTG